MIGFKRRIGGIHTGIALDLEPADGVDDVDQTDLAEVLNHDRALRIQFPFIVRCSRRWRRRFGQIGMAVVAAREFGVLEACGNPCATRESMLSPYGIRAQFGQ